MPLAQAKALAVLMLRNIRRYEQAAGIDIDLPRDVLETLQIPQGRTGSSSAMAFKALCCRWGSHPKLVYLPHETFKRYFSCCKRGDAWSVASV